MIDNKLGTQGKYLTIVKQLQLKLLFDSLWV